MIENMERSMRSGGLFIGWGQTVVWQTVETVASLVDLIAVKTLYISFTLA